MPVPGTVTAGMGRRLAAAVVDAALALVVVGVPFAVAAPGLLDAARTGTPATSPLLVVGAVASLALAVAQWWLLGSRGWTLGKRVMNLRAVSATGGAPVGPVRALVRLLVPAVAGVVPLVGPGLVHLSPFFDSSGRRQGWHDLAAGTVVLDVAAGADPSAPRGADADVVTRRLDAVLRSSGTPHEGLVPPAPSTTGASRGPVERPVDLLPPPPAPAPTDGPDQDFPDDTRMPGLVEPIAPAAPSAAPAPEPAVTADASPTWPEQEVPMPQHAVVGADRGPLSAAFASEPTRPMRRVVPPSHEVLTAVPFPSTPLDEDVESTRLRPARGKVPELASTGAQATVEITDGQRVTFSGTALVGRNPTPRPGESGALLIRVADPGRSVSKTHLLIGVDRQGLWVRDRASTNGTVVTLADGQQILCGAEQQVRLPAGASVAFGDYGLSVATVDAL